MAIATVVTRGYGSFGSVNKVPTKGYAIGAVTAIKSRGNAEFIKLRDKRKIITFRDKREII